MKERQVHAELVLLYLYCYIEGGSSGLQIFVFEEPVDKVVRPYLLLSVSRSHI